MFWAGDKKCTIKSSNSETKTHAMTLPGVNASWYNYINSVASMHTCKHTHIKTVTTSNNSNNK